MTRAIFIALATALVCAACNGDNGTSPTTTTTTGRSTENFAGTLEPGASQFYAFTVATSGTTDITLVSLRPAASVTPALDSDVSIGVGTPAGTGCALSTAATVHPALTTQLSTATTPTIYCANIADIGDLQIPVHFTIRIVHP